MPIVFYNLKCLFFNNIFFSVEPTTPVIQSRRLRTCDQLLSPPTPHRIELRCDSSEDNECKKSLISSLHGVPKLKRRNQDSVKNVEKGNHKLTEYFPVRRSSRKTKTIVLEEKQRSLEEALKNEIEEGLEVRCFEGKGRGIVATKDYIKGDFVVEYSGHLIDIVEAKMREEKYAQDQTAGCYMYYFKHNGIQYCIDATAENGKLGRLVNHSRNGNLSTKTVVLDNKPRLVLIAKDSIRKGEEILYDYGDRSKESLKYHPC
ncbi:hypothetical protein JTB14_000896 [Gonioctena quinquepunctata]|nr:hypothetical protein JTB14_000896 [Gonioctena quinquepunctata]